MSLEISGANNIGSCNQPKKSQSHGCSQGLVTMSKIDENISNGKTITWCKKSHRKFTKKIPLATCKTFASLDSMQPLLMTHLHSIVLENVYSFYMVISFDMAMWFQSHKHSNWDWHKWVNTYNGYLIEHLAWLFYDSYFMGVQNKGSRSRIQLCQLVK